MTNPFKAVVDKIVAGSKFLAEHVWTGFKSVFGSQAAKDISLAALSSAKELLKTEVGQFVQQTVSGLENSTLSGPERLASATSSVKTYLSSQGKNMETVWIQWAIQTILAFIRGLAPTQPAS